jgi:hypothetical protein
MRRWWWSLTVLCCCVGIGLLAAYGGRLPAVVSAFAGKLENRLPDPVYVALNGAPAEPLPVGQMLAAGMGLDHTYRDIWLEKTFPRGHYEGKAPYGRVCPASAPRDDCDFPSLTAALAAARDGDTLVMSPGLYEEAAVVARNGLHIIAEPGAHMRGKAAGGKGALVVAGNGTVIEGLECSDIQVSDGNGACIRLEGRDLTLRGVNFHDSQEGVLSGSNTGVVTIEDSMFSRLGKYGQAHGIYIGGGVGSGLSVTRSHFLHTRSEGHAIKSRAMVNTIRDNVIASLDQVDSRAIDLPNGGSNLITGNIIEESPESSNWDAIGIGLELGKAPNDPQANSTLIENNIFIVDRSSSDLVHVRNVPAPKIVSNIVVGGPANPLGEGNHYFRSRELAGLPPFPRLLADTR